MSSLIIQGNFKIVLDLKNFTLKGVVESEVTTSGMSEMPKQTRINTLNKEQVMLLEDIKGLSLSELARLLNYLVEGIETQKCFVKGKVPGIAIKWPDIEIKIDVIPPENEKTSRKNILVAEGLMYILSKKPNWIAKGASNGSFKDRLIIGFDDLGVVIYEGKGATYLMRHDGIKYYNIKEQLTKIRNKSEVVHIIHTDKKTWSSKIDKFFEGISCMKKISKKAIYIKNLGSVRLE